MGIRFKIPVLIVVRQILILSFISIIIFGCKPPVRLVDNRTAAFPGSASCSDSFKASSCSSACGSAEFDEETIPHIEYIPPSTKGSPQKPPELVDGDKLPSSTVETGGPGRGGCSGCGGGR
jgi:hypothetical protein